MVNTSRKKKVVWLRTDLKSDLKLLSYNEWLVLKVRTSLTSGIFQPKRVTSFEKQQRLRAGNVVSTCTVFPLSFLTGLTFT